MVLAFSILSFYVGKIKDDKRTRLEILKRKEEKFAMELLQNEKEKQKVIWSDTWTCRENQQFECHQLEVFLHRDVNFSIKIKI